MLYDPGGTCTVLAYRPAHYCLRPKLEYRLPLVVLTRLNRFTLSHYGSRTPLSTLHAGLTASHARLSTGCLLGFAGSGLSPNYTIHAELAHNFRTLTLAGRIHKAPYNNPRAKGASNLSPLRTFGPKGRQPSRPIGTCPSLSISLQGSILSFGTYACIGRIGASPWGELKMTWTGSQLIPVS